MLDPVIEMMVPCLQVNEEDIAGKTREEAVLLLLSLHEQVTILVQYCRAGMLLLFV